MDGEDHHVRFWAGEVLAAPEIAIDTETEVVDGNVVPRLAMVTASAGLEHFIIHPDDATAFLDRHRAARWIFFNVAFDYWVLHEHAVRIGSPATAALLWEKAARGEIHDTMLLDMLVNLARKGLSIPRDLAAVAGEWAGIKDLDKHDPYRLRYGEIIGMDWCEVESGFFTYAIKDAIATYQADLAMRPVATQLASPWHAWLWKDAAARFGPLSEAVQVKGAIALAAVGRNGLRVDRAALSELGAGLSERMRILERDLHVAAAGHDLVKRRKTGEIERTKTGLPSLKEAVLQDLLEKILKDPNAIGLKPVQRLADGALSLAEEDWAPYTQNYPLVAAWLDLSRCAKLKSFAILPGGERVHPRYNVLMRTGRTSASSPNLQQVPRGCGFRECYVPTFGHYFLIIDYRFIELVTLAAICEQRFGFSRLAEVIRKGIDPHCFTAALITGKPLDDFMALAKTDPARFKDLRQKAKALNFGIPGGLGARSLLAYAQAQYGVTLTLEQATEWREKVVNEIYPELARYLADRTLAAIAWNLGAIEDELWGALAEGGKRPEWLPRCVAKVLSGHPTKADGTPYQPDFVDRIWAGLVRANRRPELLERLTMRQAGPDLAELCLEVAVAPTGRIRGGVRYTEARNTPFQGLASDGAKLACFELLRAGYHVVGFVHDEFIIELPGDADHTKEAERIEQIVCGGMSAAVNGAVPVGAEFALSTCWSKRAKAIYDEHGCLLPWSPKES